MAQVKAGFVVVSAARSSWKREDGATNDGGSAGTNPGFGSEIGIHGRTFEKSWMDEPIGVSRLRRSCRQSPISLNSVAQVTTEDRQKTNCDVRWVKAQRAIQMA
jgi:hypothetical protein